jgi:hypothetical protein
VQARPNAINGVCGPADGVAVSSAPTTGLCSSGIASGVSGTGPWEWSCFGKKGGTTASCSAPLLSDSGGGGGGGGASGLLPADRDASANWKMAGLVSIGGIPNRTSVCRTVYPRGSGQDDTANIQGAIDACPAGQVVSLASGTFTIAEGNYVLLDRGVTLRGAGPGKTILQRTNGAKLGSYSPGSNPSPMVIAGSARWGNGFTIATNLSADTKPGDTSVQVADATGFSVGQVVLLDESSGAGWQTDPTGQGQVWASPDFRVIWQKHNPSLNGDDFDSSTYPYTSGSAGCWFASCDRPNNEIKQVSAISGNTITFDSPVMMAYRTSHQAKLSGGGTFTTDAGIEDLTVAYGDDGNIQFKWCAYCWAKGVESRYALNGGFRFETSFRSQLEKVYVHDPVWPVNGGAGYNISLAWGTSEILIENSISVKANKVIVAQSSGAGSVVAYNYMDDQYISGQDGWVEIGLNGSHMVGSHHMLFEGNYVSNMDSDYTHGNSIYMTYFRNYSSGYRGPFTDLLNGTAIDDLNNKPGNNGPLRAAAAMAYSRWMSYIGNVLGTPGHMSGWTYSGGGWNPTVFMLGWGNYGVDAGVANTSILNGNYDYLTQSIKWDANDTTHFLPDSLYLSQTPAFFGSRAWPWITPDGSTQLQTLPAKARYDAGTPFAPD